MHDDVVGFLARLFGTADVPWTVRWVFGFLIALVLLYLLLIRFRFQDQQGQERLRDWAADAIKIVFGAAVGILSQAAGLQAPRTASDNQAIVGQQSLPKSPAPTATIPPPTQK